MDYKNTIVIENDLEEPPLLEKHQRYLNIYKPGDLYWGVGIENECYLEFSKRKTVPLSFIKNNGRRERYSIDYFTNYYDNIYRESLDYTFNKSNYDLPVMMNAHSFLNCDINNQPKTLYTKNSENNPNYSGKSLFEYLQEKNQYFVDEYNKSFVFDGDTVEFISQKFYKATINDSIDELIELKKNFNYQLQKTFRENNLFYDYGEISISTNNNPFAIFLTNSKNYNIFNNMTYHLNFTMPTKLDSKSKIENRAKFTKDHSNAIRAIQWIIPLFIAKYGSGDILRHPNKYLTLSSQRCALSRYIGVGTYDTNKMIPGKILQINTDESYIHKYNGNWYKKYYEHSGYKALNYIGMDFNFNKHKNHGIECRIFDYFPEVYLEEVMKFIVYLLDFSLDIDVLEPASNKEWNELVYNIIIHGNQYRITNNILETYSRLFSINFEDNTIEYIYYSIFNQLDKKYKNTGLCSQCMIRKTIDNTVETIDNFNISIETINENITKIPINNNSIYHLDFPSNHNYIFIPSCSIPILNETMSIEKPPINKSRRCRCVML